MANKDKIRSLSEELLHDWCRALRHLQAEGTGNPRLDGGILCPACGMIHGRCIDAVYPFMRMAREARESGNFKESQDWIQSAERLLLWADHTIHGTDGVYLNDIDAKWTGTTVFFAISLAEALWFHGDLLEAEVYEAWKCRLRQAAEYLYSFEGLLKNNINYPISNALAMYECGMVLGEKRYQKKALELAQIAEPLVTENGLLMGEGVPWSRVSDRGCHPVDLGYNVEETLPSLALYGKLSGDDGAWELAKKCLLAHKELMLKDGGWDNSFGTRNYKWTYWGSRTSDGCGLGYLLLADEYPECADAALKNMELLKACTWDGLLTGGPHYHQAEQAPCVHHSFCHAKVLAGILDRNLPAESVSSQQMAMPAQTVNYYPELSLWRVLMPPVTASILAYDWEHTQGGHVSGGTISMLHHEQLGPLLCAGMGEYWTKEPHNMQIPWNVKHECLALRIEQVIDGNRYSSIYEDKAQVKVVGNRIEVSGELKDKTHQRPLEKPLGYRFVYEVMEEWVEIQAEFLEGSLICPVISSSDEAIDMPEGIEDALLIIEKSKGHVALRAEGHVTLPYGTERIFQLVPGFQALRVDIKPVDGRAGVRLSWKTRFC